MRGVLRRNDRRYQAHRLLARLLHLAGAHDEALEHSHRCQELNPYDSDMIVAYGISLICVGRAEEGVALVERAMGSLLRRLLVFTAACALLGLAWGPAPGIVAALALLGYPVSYGLRKVFPPS